MSTDEKMRDAGRSLPRHQRVGPGSVIVTMTATVSADRGLVVGSKGSTGGS